MRLVSRAGLFGDTNQRLCSQLRVREERIYYLELFGEYVQPWIPKGVSGLVRIYGAGTAWEWDNLA